MFLKLKIVHFQLQSFYKKVPCGRGVHLQKLWMKLLELNTFQAKTNLRQYLSDIKVTICWFSGIYFIDKVSESFSIL